MTANTIPPLSVWPSCPPFLSSFGNTQEGPSRLRSAPITDPLSRGFGIPNRSPDPLAQRAGRDHPLIPFRYPKKSTGIQPHPVGPCVPHHGTPVAPRRRRVEGTAMFDSAMAASTPSPRGPKSRRRGGRLAGSHQATFRQSFMNRQVMHRRGGGLCTQVPHRRLL